MKSYGVNAYRFSIAWSRVIVFAEEGSGEEDEVNAEGLGFYSDLVDELLRAGITPFVTLFHWDLPVALVKRYDGLLDQARYTKDFLRYAWVCFERLGNRVKHWITYNEPGVYCGWVHNLTRAASHDTGDPGDKSTEPFLVAHTMLVSHGHAVKLYKERFQPQQKGTIGITLSGNYSSPWDAADPLDVEAAERARLFEIGWYADPVFGSGDYPQCMRKQLGNRLPVFTEDERVLVKGSSEFYGMNSYTTFFVRHKEGPADPEDNSGNVEKLIVNKDGLSRGPESDTEWLATTPWGFRKLLGWIWDRFHPAGGIYITENGTTAKDEHNWKPNGNNDILEDVFRQEFFAGYLGAIADAAKGGIDIRSYFAWSFLDNWEWADGFTNRFGVTWIDFEAKEKTRYPKKSAAELRRMFHHLIKHSS